MSTTIAAAEHASVQRIVPPFEHARAWRHSAAAYARTEPAELARLVEQNAPAFWDEIVTVEAATDQARETMERAARSARANAEGAAAVVAAGHMILPGTDEWRRLELAVVEAPGLEAYADALRGVLERPWPSRDSLMDGLRAVAASLIPLVERQAAEALGEQLIEVRRSVTKALGLAASLDNTVLRAAEVSGFEHSRRWDREALSMLRAAASISFVARETARES